MARSSNERARIILFSLSLSLSPCRKFVNRFDMCAMLNIKEVIDMTEKLNCRLNGIK